MAPHTYKGVPVPPRLRQYWDKPTGRWWRAGVDAAQASQPDNRLTYEGQSWEVDDRSGALDYQENSLLFEVWVKRPDDDETVNDTKES